MVMERAGLRAWVKAAVSVGRGRAGREHGRQHVDVGSARPTRRGQRSGHRGTQLPSGTHGGAARMVGRGERCQQRRFFGCPLGDEDEHATKLSDETDYGGRPTGYQNHNLYRIRPGLLHAHGVHVQYSSTGIIQLYYTAVLYKRTTPLTHKSLPAAYCRSTMMADFGVSIFEWTSREEPS